MRDDNEVNNEIARLTVILKDAGMTRERRSTIHEQVLVLALRLTADQAVVRFHGCDPAAMQQAARWLAGEAGIERPSIA